MPIKTIEESIYNSRIHFIFDVKKEVAEKYTNKFLDIVGFSDHWEKAGFMYGDAGEYFIIIPNKKPTWDIATIIAHESLHVTSRVLRSKGIKLSCESEEAFTYYQSWIIQSLLDIYHSHKKRKTMKAKPAKASIKKAIDKFAKKDKKEDMKMIKAAVSKAKKK